MPRTALVSPCAHMYDPGACSVQRFVRAHSIRHWRIDRFGLVIYYRQQAACQIYLLFLYPKNVRSTLSPVELRTLRKLVLDADNKR